jgi:hypothetical protein
VIEQLFGELRVPVRATLEPQNRGATLTVVVNLDDRSEREPEPETPVAALVEDLHRYRIVLTEGRFVSSSGVDIVDDGAAAKLSVSEETLEAGGVLRFELRWRTAR